MMITADNIETERLVFTYLDRLNYRDVAGVEDILGNFDTAWWFGVRPIMEYDSAQDFIAWGNFNRDGVEQYGIYEKGSDEMAGIIQIINIPHCNQAVEIGYALSVNSRGKGLMTEALKALCDSLFETPSLQEIRCLILPENDDSIGVVTRCGFKRVEKKPEERAKRNLDGEATEEFVLKRDS